MQRMDAILSDTLRGITSSINEENIPREDVVNVFQNTKGQYVVIFYR